MKKDIGYLVLENGKVYPGQWIGYKKEVIFECVFNTSMFGYTEMLSDPSYFGQGIVFSYPSIGNYGVNEKDMESNKC
jgi:carbamoyl-phosphate synthase small subunit